MAYNFRAVVIMMTERTGTARRERVNLVEQDGSEKLRTGTAAEQSSEWSHRKSLSSVA